MPHHTTPHHTTPHHTTPVLSPKIKITFIRRDVPGLDWMIEAMRITDPEILSRFVRDDENPDYIVASDKSLVVIDDCMRLQDYLRRLPDSIFIFLTLECIDPDMNIFDYAFTMNPDLKCGDRIVHNYHYICGRGSSTDYYANDLTLENARKILEVRPKFCNFIYSHTSKPRDTFFHLLSQYKPVDSLGSHLNNTGTRPTRWAEDWYHLSIEMKKGYKFSIAMENAVYKGYTTEKIISSLQAHTVPIYWGDPAVAEYINPKAFINCMDYASFEEVIERVKEIDNNDDLWLDMVTQPWQTEEQRKKTLQEAAECQEFVRNIFYQDIRSARRRPIGLWGDICRKHFTGYAGIMPPLYVRVFMRIKYQIAKFLPESAKAAIKRFLHMD